MRMKWKFKYLLLVIISSLAIVTVITGYIAEERIIRQRAEASEMATATTFMLTETIAEEAKEIIEQENKINEEEPKVVSLGEFKLTAYCSCEKCCDGWANNRPVDEYGNEIVYGSIGEKLVEGVSIAVDPNVIPYGSEVVISGSTYIAHDTGGAIDGNRIDVYHNDHQNAIEFGVQYCEVFIVVD